MTTLYPFQVQASDQIAARIVDYVSDPFFIGRGSNRRRVPFIQLLSSITASGKTVILADAVSTVAAESAVPPVVLWLSRATVVVEQTYSALAAGGPLNDLIQDFETAPLADLDIDRLRDEDNPFLYFATVGTFNSRDRAAGHLHIFRSAIDDAERSTWESLKVRPAIGALRRPLLIVYDEAHNLSDQQTQLLLELEPDAFLLSTATQRLPRDLIDNAWVHLTGAVGFEESELITVVDAAEVRDAGLTKTKVELIWRQAPAEDVITDLVKQLRDIQTEATAEGLPGRPKAVYVAKTNVIEGTDDRDNPRRPFTQREAPPILIWRHLTERLGVAPAEIAVYANLSVDRDYPLPDDFRLFSGGDRDYVDFVAGDFQHIIFNLALQEGWDDPFVYCAYIDKSMGSHVQVEQVVGRLLRQPTRNHFPGELLNTALIYVRVEAAGVFGEVVDSVTAKLESAGAHVKIVKTPPGTPPRETYRPKGRYTVPKVSIITDDALSPIQTLIHRMTDYRSDNGTNIDGVGRITRVQRVVGDGSIVSPEWTEIGHSAKVLCRWLFNREVRKVHQGALGVAETSDAKFDARVGLGSRAAEHVTRVAHDVAQAYLDHAQLRVRKPNPYVVSDIQQRRADVILFAHSVHEGYDTLNSFERACAAELDSVGLPWCRNPSLSGYSIPLITPGRTQNFYPDFLIWQGDDVYALDTKGSHLHADARRKMTTIDQGTSGRRLFVRFITEGRVGADGEPTADNTGYTSWKFRGDGNPHWPHFETLAEAVASSLRA